MKLFNYLKYFSILLTLLLLIRLIYFFHESIINTFHVDLPAGFLQQLLNAASCFLCGWLISSFVNVHWWEKNAYPKIFKH